LKTNPNDAATYVLLANTYAFSGQVKKQATVWNEMKEKNIKKIPGATWVTVNGKTEMFYVDSTHSYLLNNTFLFFFFD
jgi:hypothetical protein